MEESLGEGEVTHLVSSWDIECLLHSDWNLQHHHSWLQTFGHGLEPHHWLPWAISLDMAGYGFLPSLCRLCHVPYLRRLYHGH